MTIKTFFAILSVLSFLFGVGFVLAPDWLRSLSSLYSEDLTFLAQMDRTDRENRATACSKITLRL